MRDLPCMQLIGFASQKIARKDIIMKEENSLTIKFPVKSFRKIPNPVTNSNNSGESKPEMYQLIVDVKEIPDYIPMDTNPRAQNLDTKVAKKIKESLLNPTERNFYLLNRGLLLSAGAINFDNLKNIVTIDFTDTAFHGNVDGGHTYKVILENRDQLEPNTQFVKIEVLTGIEDMFEDVAASRNTSFQVKTKSIANLRDRFRLVKDAIASQPYANNINYKENDQYKLDIEDILALFFMFHLGRFPQRGNSYPISSYSSKKACLDQYLNDVMEYEKGDEKANPYYKMSKIMPDIIRLFDKIEVNIANYYKGDATGIKRYGSVVGVATSRNGKKFKSKYLETEMDYASPNGFLYPILGAFRALVTEKDGFYTWIKDPFQVLEKIGPELVGSTIDMSRQLGNNPNATGKSAILWSQLYMTVLMQTFAE